MKLFLPVGKEEQLLQIYVDTRQNRNTGNIFNIIFVIFLNIDNKTFFSILEQKYKELFSTVISIIHSKK